MRTADIPADGYRIRCIHSRFNTPGTPLPHDKLSTRQYRVNILLIIPVLDLSDGRVVHARRGERAQYQPLASPLSNTNAPEDVLSGFLQIFPFPIIYVADLNAITNTGDNLEKIAALTAKFPQIEFWLDDGIRAQRAGVQYPPRIVPIVGSESLNNHAEWLAISTTSGGKAILSLDFAADGFVGDEHILEHAESWPRRVIAMTLSRVGSDAGPEMQLLASLRQRAPQCELFAAGGVRNTDDIVRLQECAIQGALVATALHAGQLTSEALTALNA